MGIHILGQGNSTGINSGTNTDEHFNKYCLWAMSINTSKIEKYMIENNLMLRSSTSEQVAKQERLEEFLKEIQHSIQNIKKYMVENNLFRSLANGIYFIPQCLERTMVVQII